jgi:hypothetical protein
MIYLSGSISKRDFNEAFDHFKRVEKYFDQQKSQTYNPVILGAPDKDFTWEKLMRLAVTSMLIKCDKICMLEGWQNSKGAVIERSLALTLGMEVIYEGVDFHTTQ